MALQVRALASSFTELEDWKILSVIQRRNGGLGTWFEVAKVTLAGTKNSSVNLIFFF